MASRRALKFPKTKGSSLIDEIHVTICVKVCVSARERVRSVHHVDNTDSYLHTCIYAAQHYVIRVLLIAKCLLHSQ